MSAGTPSAKTMATRCNSPPDKCWTSWSMIPSIFNGLTTSATLIFFKNNWRTVPGNFGAIFCGFMETFIFGAVLPSSGEIAPANNLQKVVLPVPFSPIMTMISESVKSPAWIFKWKSPWVYSIPGYWNAREASWTNASLASDILNCKDSVLKRKFSVGMLPSKKMLIPSRTDAGKVTTP
ncbi:hypothetical protein BABINDRAFT_172165 [Babjeviella inositovora NRRL Y-12698]|uniref:Uncharacterized protein n=1 Tax=Babjeviella inositovora NRRL Y-12698 TaxID=984486 RepID=A0A1E3QMP5_9ASCO|nr:uncharacterized protein BABINDRAFT_172165 [Babjeviella inositovora NRRL Y-12698]ODQ78910.1 hypothetical protein BABINDRAFT_172165 [Babjeviella inositovora NRRL Y-12698]